MYVSAAIQARVKAKLVECIAKLENRYNRKFEMPRISYSMGVRAAGRAKYGTWEIELSAPYLMDPANVDEMIDDTTPHELAHLVTFRVYPETQERGMPQFTSRGYKRGKREVHGPCWQEVMWAMGVNPSRTHNMKLSEDSALAGNVRQRVRYDWLCTGCGNVVQLGPKHHKSQLTSGGVYHKKCGRGTKLIHPDGAHSTHYTKPVPTLATPRPYQQDAIKAIMDKINSSTITVTDLTGKKPVITSYPPSKPAAPITGNKNAYASKLDHCKDIYKLNKLSGRQTVIMLFVSIAGCTPAGAGTYYATCKKLFG